MNKFSNAAFVIVAILGTAVCGCSTDTSSSSVNNNQDKDIAISTFGSDDNVKIGAGDGDSISINGMTISYPHSFVRNDLSVDNGDVRVDFKDHKLEISGGVLLFDGKQFGRVQPGDEVEIRNDGSVSVNSETVVPR